MKINYLNKVKNIKHVFLTNIPIILGIALLFTLSDILVKSVHQYFLFFGVFIYMFIKLKYFKVLNKNLNLKIYNEYKQMKFLDFFKNDSDIIKQIFYIFIISFSLLIILFLILKTKLIILTYIYIVYIIFVFININMYFAILIKNNFNKISFKDSLVILNIFKIKKMVLEGNYFNTFMWIIIQFSYISIALLFFNLSTIEIISNVSYILDFIAYIFIVINIFNDYIYYKSIMD